MTAKQFSEDAAQGKSAASQLVFLSERLSAAPEGSEEHKKIQIEIDITKDALKAQHELLRVLADAHDLERALAMQVSNSVFEDRLQKQMRELMEQDLTPTEALRLLRLFAKQLRQVGVRQAERAKTRKQAAND